MKNTFIQLALLFAGFGLSTSMFAQKFEAENGTLTLDAEIVSCATCSNAKAVNTKGGNITIPFTTTTDGYYDISIKVAAPYGDKTNNFVLDNISTSFSLQNNSSYSTLKLLSSQKVIAGSHTLQITNSWGWIHVDYIELVKIDPASRFNVNKTLNNINATPEANCLYKFLLDNYTKKIISGAMTLNSIAESKAWLIDYIKVNTNKEVALVGIDFLHVNAGYSWYNDDTPVDDAIAYYKRNGIPTMMWHWRDPSRLTNSFYKKDANHTDGTTFDISKINDPTSSEYKAMLSDIDYVANQLKRAQTAKVPILWRPLHEAAGGWFWWGAKDGASCKKLWQIMYDRMVNFHGLNNLIWVWTNEPSEDGTWYPGDEYVDIVGRDIYTEFAGSMIANDHTSQIGSFNSTNGLYNGTKMITLSECGAVPLPVNLKADEAAWSWFMPWYKEYITDTKYNTVADWQAIMSSDYVITLDEMPVLSDYCLNTAVFADQNEENSEGVYPTIIDQILHVKSETTSSIISIYNAQGMIVKTINAEAKESIIEVSELKSGMYFVSINGKNSTKIFKK